ncbi:hypothetical protein AB0O76_24170 [Streptomyces sp. NPDC086554]
MGDPRLEPLAVSGDERVVSANRAKRRTTAQGLAKRASVTSST